MITWLSNVFTGRFTHWHNVNDAYASALFDRAIQFPPSIAPLFAEFVRSSYILIDSLVGPKNGKNRIIKKDSNSITAEQFKSMYHLSIWAFLAVFLYTNRSFEKSFFAACDDFIGIQEDQNEIVETILSTPEFDLAKFCPQLFQKYCSILNYEKAEFLDWTILTSAFSISYSRAMEAYKTALSDLPSKG